MKCKKAVAVLLAVLLVMCFSVTAFAADDNGRVVSRTVEQYADGAYAVITVYDTTTARAYEKSGYKNFDYYESGTLQWTFTAYGTFSYNGSTATCIAASYGCNINNSSWTRVSGEASPSGSAVIAKGVMEKKGIGKRVYPQVIITCTPNGVLS